MTRSRLLVPAAAIVALAGLASPAMAQLEVTYRADAGFCTGITADDISDIDMIGDYAVGYGADDFNPCPTNRVYFNYDHFHYDPSFNVNAVTLGFEKTFMDGLASIEVRVPFFRDEFDSGLGDLSIIGKYAFTRDDNSVISAGLDVRVPTSEFSDQFGFLPFVAWSWAPTGNLLLQGHHAVGFIPSDPFDPIVSTDITASLVLNLDNGWLKSVAPQVGLHYFVPTNLPVDEHSLNATLGVHAMLENGLIATLAVGFPLADLDAYDRRIVAGLQWNFGAPPPPPPPP